jgi:hypothetical protein
MSPDPGPNAKKLVYKRPVEVVHDARPERLMQVGLAILLAALVMSLLGSKALLEWANNLPIGRVSDFVLYLAQGWQDLMQAAHMTAFASGVRKLLQWLQDLR